MDLNAILQALVPTAAANGGWTIVGSTILENGAYNNLIWNSTVPMPTLAQCQAQETLMLQTQYLVNRQKGYPDTATTCEALYQHIVNANDALLNQIKTARTAADTAIPVGSNIVVTPTPINIPGTTTPLNLASRGK